MKWISVKQQLPPLDEELLLASQGWLDGQGVFERKWHQWVHAAKLVEPLRQDSKVTHWMRIPKPPEIKQSGKVAIEKISDGLIEKGALTGIVDAQIQELFKRPNAELCGERSESERTTG